MQIFFSLLFTVLGVVFVTELLLVQVGVSANVQADKHDVPCEHASSCSQTLNAQISSTHKATPTIRIGHVYVWHTQTSIHNSSLRLHSCPTASAAIVATARADVHHNTSWPCKRNIKTYRRTSPSYLDPALNRNM